MRVDSVSYEVRSTRVEASFDEVVWFYDRELDATPFVSVWEFGVWRAERVDDFQVLYWCFGALSDLWQSLETGCILVKAEGEETLIETVWYLTGDDVYSCRHDLSVEREQLQSTNGFDK